MVPLDRDRSEWQTPAAARRTWTCPGPGSGSSMPVISSGAPMAGRTAARTAMGARTPSELEGLGLEVLGESVRAEFPADAGLLVTAEGGEGLNRPPLMSTWPVSMRRAKATASASSAAQTAPARPYTVPLAMRRASSSSSYLRIDRTGPKISSWAMVISGVTSAKTVGLTK